MRAYPFFWLGYFTRGTLNQTGLPRLYGYAPQSVCSTRKLMGSFAVRLHVPGEYWVPSAATLVLHGPWKAVVQALVWTVHGTRGLRV